MRSKSAKKRKPKVIYYPAPTKSRVPYFVTSFILTLAAALCGIGFLIADRNSQRLGWGNNIEVFSIIDSGKQIGVTVMDNSFTIDKVYLNGTQAVLKKVRLAQSYIEPVPLQFAESVGAKLGNVEQKLLSDCNFISTACNFNCCK